jgi:hypothetical protein
MNALLPPVLLAVLLSPAAPLLAQHAHLNAGAVGSTAGTPLSFANGDLFVTNSGYFLPLKAATNGPYAGFYQGSLTLTALPATGDNGGPTFAHAAPGAHLEAEIASLSGPTGGAFGFWDSDGEEDATELTFSVPVGETAGQRRFTLSQNDGSPEADPFGHVHGRRFTATLPGLYVVGFRLVDTSAHGPGGGPLHPASSLFPMYLQAGTTIAGIEQEPAGWFITFAAEKGRTYQLQQASQLSPQAEWQTVGEPLVGAGKLERVGPLGLGSGTVLLRLLLP